ncbi:MAG: serine protease [Myxococcota bacterium]
MTVPAEPQEALVLAATVRVEAVDWLGRARTGLGVVVGTEGRVLVPTRLVAHAETLRLTFTDGVPRQDVGVVWVDHGRDLALLALDQPCAGLPVRADTIAVDEPVFAMGADGTVAAGRVTWLAGVRLTHDAPGALGGAVVDTGGRLLGIGGYEYDGAYPIEPGERRETPAFDAPPYDPAAVVTRPTLAVPWTVAPTARATHLGGAQLGGQRLGEASTPAFGGWGVPFRGLRQGIESLDAELEDVRVDIQWVQARAAAVAVTHTFSRNATDSTGRLAGTPRSRARGNLALVLDEHDWAGWSATRITAAPGLLVFHLVKGSYRRTLTEACDAGGTRCSLTLIQEATPPAG